MYVSGSNILPLCLWIRRKRKRGPGTEVADAPLVNGVRCSKAWTARAGLVTYCHLSGRGLSQQLQNCKRLDPLFKLLAVILI